ncbi:hypothetical protein HanPI659440_Chr16g0653681 [Helianthus annuus]|nr:hypothetical protein HanPI659440_Chr16g0653681 [Helianthus annuus]
MNNFNGVQYDMAGVRKCESQIKASWTALKAWKSGYKSYLNKEDVLLNKIGFIPINMFVM